MRTVREVEGEEDLESLGMRLRNEIAELGGVEKQAAFPVDLEKERVEREKA